MDDDIKIRDGGFPRFIPWKARQLAGKYGFGHDEVEDIEQELRLTCLKRLKRFDSTRSNPHTFMRLVVNRCAASLVASQKAQCRDYRLSRSLEEPDQSPDCLLPRAGATNLGQPNQYEDDLQRRLDIQRAITKLPSPLGDVCRLLMAIDDVSIVAAGAGISRATLYRRIQQIRVRFKDMNLQEYL